MGKKLSFSKKITVFSAFQQSFYVQNAKILSITFQKQQMDYDYTKLLQLFIKPRHFHKKNKINIVTKPILSKILAACLNFLFIFKVFSSFLQFNSQNSQTNFVSYQKKTFVSFCFVKKNRITQICSTWNLGRLLIYPPVCFTWNKQQNPNTSRE